MTQSENIWCKWDVAGWGQGSEDLLWGLLQTWTFTWSEMWNHIRIVYDKCKDLVYYFCKGWNVRNIQMEEKATVIHLVVVSLISVKIFLHDYKTQGGRVFCLISTVVPRIEQCQRWGHSMNIVYLVNSMKWWTGRRFQCLARCQHSERSLKGEVID